MMGDSGASYENIFSEWLAKQVSPAQLSAIYSVFTDINNFCLSRKILKKPLFETDDLVTLAKVRETIERNKIFAFIYRKQKSAMTAAIQHYCRFIKGTKDNNSLIEPMQASNDKSKSLEQETPAGNSLLDYLVANNISFIDNRQKNGCLWIIGGEELRVFADECSAHGVTFHFKADGARATKYHPAWWTTDDFNNSAKSEPTVLVADNVPEDKLSQAASSDKVITESDLKMEPSVGTTPQAASEIEALLSEEIFSPLKFALTKENIHTIEELKSLKLWAFMNQNNLYSISMRQTVLAEVRQLLAPETSENPELLYELHCGSAVYSGDTPARIFLRFCEDIAKKYPLLFRSFLDKTIGTSNVKIYRSPENENFIRMENPTCYISTDLAEGSVIAAVEWIMQRCVSATIPVSIKEPNTLLVQPPHAETTQTGYDNAQEPPVRSVSSQESEGADSEQIAKIEKIVLAADVDGITYDSLYNTLRLTMVATKALVQKCKRIVEIKGKLYHEDAFIDWNDGAKHVCLIMEKLMQKNGGYISAAQLYDYTRAEMNMFLNDNGMNDERSVYGIAQHLFEKNNFEGHHYSFTGKTHISKSEDAISSNFDIICKFAEDQGGVFREDDLTEYLAGIGIKTGNLRQQMRLGKRPEFFFYESGTIISAKSMGIDDLWKESVGRALHNLLSDADGHIVLRQIQPVWYESLPALPEHRRWTPLLLQFVLQFYGKEFGAKTIMAMHSQSMDTLHAMLVKTDGLIQNFGDAVVACLIENEIEQRSFEAEELRQFLVKTGMIQGNELIWNMPKALAKDERFAWDAKGENVTVRV